MSWRYPRHEQVDDAVLGDGLCELRCRCGWASPPVPVYLWDLDPDDPEAVQIDRDRIVAWDAHYAPLVNPNPDQVLDLRRDAYGGWRHYLDGEAVHAGEGVQLLLPDGTWWSGRYESRWPPGSRDSAGPVAMFHAPLGGPWADNHTEAVVEAKFPLPARAVLRWPARQGRS